MDALLASNIFLVFPNRNLSLIDVASEPVLRDGTAMTLEIRYRPLSRSGQRRFVSSSGANKLVINNVINISLSHNIFVAEQLTVGNEGERWKLPSTAASLEWNFSKQSIRNR